jgi:hypothetical protein
MKGNTEILSIRKINQLASTASVVACWLVDYASTNGIHYVHYTTESNQQETRDIPDK